MPGETKRRKHPKQQKKRYAPKGISGICPLRRPAGKIGTAVLNTIFRDIGLLRLHTPPGCAERRCIRSMIRPLCSSFPIREIRVRLHIVKTDP